MNHKSYSNWCTDVTQNLLKLVKIDPHTLLKFTHKRFSKLLKIRQNWSSHVTQIDQQMLLKITLNYSELIHKGYSNWPTSNPPSFLNLVEFDPHTLLKLANKVT